MAVLAKPTSERPEENVIAARIVELSDRLGGFIIFRYSHIIKTSDRISERPPREAVFLIQEIASGSGQCCR
jgi:hypothetical protein